MTSEFRRVDLSGCLKKNILKYFIFSKSIFYFFSKIDILFYFKIFYIFFGLCPYRCYILVRFEIIQIWIFLEQIPFLINEGWNTNNIIHVNDTSSISNQNNNLIITKNTNLSPSNLSISENESFY